MSLKEYVVVIGGIEHTLLLSEEDAKAQGATVKAAAPANKARIPRNKSGDE